MLNYVERWGKRAVNQLISTLQLRQGRQVLCEDQGFMWFQVPAIHCHGTATETATSFIWPHVLHHFSLPGNYLTSRFSEIPQSLEFCSASTLPSSFFLVEWTEWSLPFLGHFPQPLFYVPFPFFSVALESGPEGAQVRNLIPKSLQLRSKLSGVSGHVPHAWVD